MRRRAIGVVVLLLAAEAVRGAPAPDPRVHFETIATTSLPAPTEVLVVTPPSYASSPERRYPVLYFLHDGYGDGRTLARRGVAEQALALMADGRLPEFLIVAPGAPGTWFSDSHDGKRLYEQFLTDDLPRGIAERYPRPAGQGSRGDHRASRWAATAP